MTADVVAFGASHSTPEKRCKQLKIRSAQSPDPMPEQAILRSDHYTLVKKGIPAVFLMTGFNSRTSEDGGEVGVRSSLNITISRVTDNLDINYEAGARFTNINFAIGEEIANAAQRPQWLEDSFFGKQFND